LFFTGGEAQFDLGNIRMVPKSVDAAADALTCEALAGIAPPALDEAVSEIFGNPTWDAEVTTWTAQTGGDWSPSEGLLTTTVTGEGADTEVNVVYSTDKPESDKGIVIIVGESQNLADYAAEGSLRFDLYVEDYASNTDGLVLKMEAPSTPGPDYFVGASADVPAGEWHSISIPIADLGLDDIITDIAKPLAILPAWGSPQGGVSFKFKNLRIVMNDAADAS
jgi:beta-glucosidase